MAITLENANAVWQRVNIASQGMSPWVRQQLKVLKQALSQDFRNKDLQFVAFDRTTNGSDGGNADAVIADAACRVVAIVGRKYTTATSAYLKASNHASAIQAQGEIILNANEASEEVVYTNPKGHPMSTGVTLATVTAYNGTTRNTTAASFDGFVIIAAP